MAQRCPVCGQTLPKGMDAEQLHSRMEKIGVEAKRREAERVRREERQKHRQALHDMKAQLRKDAMKDAKSDFHHEIQAYKAQHEKEQRQQAMENLRLKHTADELSQRLSRQTSEQMGEMGEMEVFTALKNAFPPPDVIQRIGKGVRGARKVIP